MRRLSIILFAALLAAGCSSTSAVLKEDPQMLGYKVWNISGVACNNSDFSGLVFMPGATRWAAAFNSGGLYWMEIPQDSDTELKLTPLLAYGTHFNEGTRDFEAITVDPRSADIYYAQERSQRDKSGNILHPGNTIYRLRAPEYNQEEIVYSFSEEEFPLNNIGLEGLTFLKKGVLLAGREGNSTKGEAPLVYTLKVKGGSALCPGGNSASSIAGIISKQNFFSVTKQIADLVYDPVRKCLWLTDSDMDKKLYRVSMEGEVLNEYDLSFISNAEAICIDRSRSCIWIGSDETPSKLYKISFKNL